MRTQSISINIEGDFIDSFIYSGTLFLVNADSKISTHDWEALVSLAIKKINLNCDSVLYDFLKDCRKNTHLENQDSLSLHIDKKELKEKQISTLSLDGWPTDINIYANRFYIASENGVEELPFNWQSKQLEPMKRFHIWRKYAYKVSANDAHRLAIAAGQNGVITALPRGGYIEKGDITTLLEIHSQDCEWIGRNLIANSNEGAFLSTFPGLPKKPEGKTSQEYWNQFNEIKKQAPQTGKIDHPRQGTVVYAWIAGSKLFSLLNTGELLMERTDTSINTKSIEIDIGNQFPHIDKILAARSGLFGTVIEIDDKLYTMTEDGIETVSTRPVSWRVYPRAKNYLNHLHIVEKDQLIIKAYLPSAIHQSDNFGISIEDVL